MTSTVKTAADVKAEQKRAERKRAHLVEYRAPENIRRRKRLEANCPKWLRHYLPNRFPLPFGPVHLELIGATLRAIVSGTSVTAAAPRGFGKTAVFWGVALYAVLSGQARFIVVAGWKQTAGVELLEQWLDALSTNEQIRADYPCVCDPFVMSTQSKRLQGMLRSVDPDHRAGCDVRKGRGTVLLPETREPGGRVLPQAALAGVSINGSVKGLNIGLLNGEALRPDIVLLDDPQDQDTAESKTLVQKIVKRIDYSIRSLSGPRRRLTVAAAVTCVETDDVSEHLLTRPGTEAIRIGQIMTWPDGWDAKDSPSRKLWEAWNAERIEGLQNRNGGKRARAFYKANKAALTKGMTVSWSHRFHEGDVNRPADPDALFSAMWDFYDLGEEAFMAERQNRPIKKGVTVYSLTPGIIISRTDKDRQPWTPHEWARLKIASTDVNPSYGLTWGVCEFGDLQLSSVLGYGIHDMSVPIGATKGETDRATFDNLTLLGRRLAGLPCRPEAWFVDAGGAAFDVVLQFCCVSAKLCGIQAMPCTGRGARNYRPFGKSVFGIPKEQSHMAVDLRGRKWLAFNADYWREAAQKSWTGNSGAPGSCTLPAGNHREFADQICREQLSGKGEVGGQMVWTWNTLPGKHDFDDVMTMLFMGAAWSGIGTSVAVTKRKYTETRKPKVQRE